MRSALLALILSACATTPPGPVRIRPDCGAPCCVSSTDPADDEGASVPCDGPLLADPDMGAACQREPGRVEACAR